MDKTINDIISKLKVLSKVQAGQKLIEDSHISIMECNKNNWDRFIKWWLGETRHSTLNKLQGFYSEIKDLIDTLNQNPTINKTALERINSELTASLRGLNNLMLSYQSDRTVVSQLETLTENLKIELNRLETILNQTSNQDNNNEHEEQSRKQQRKAKNNELPPIPTTRSPPPPPEYQVKLAHISADEFDSD